MDRARDIAEAIAELQPEEKEELSGRETHLVHG
jgi:hypothetical protein